MESMKFKIINEEHSKAIQEQLFRLGYKWAYEPKDKPKHVETGYLFAENDDKITYCTSVYSYDTSSVPERTLMYLLKQPKPSETITQHWFKITSHAKDAPRPYVEELLYKSVDDFLKEEEKTMDEFHFIACKEVEKHTYNKGELVC